MNTPFRDDVETGADASAHRPDALETKVIPASLALATANAVRDDLRAWIGSAAAPLHLGVEPGATEHLAVQLLEAASKSAAAAGKELLFLDTAKALLQDRGPDAKTATEPQA